MAGAELAGCKQEGIDHKERSAANRNQIPLFPRGAQRRRERGEKILAQLRDVAGVQGREHGEAKARPKMNGREKAQKSAKRGKPIL